MPLWQRQENVLPDILLLADTTLFREANMGLQEVLLPLCPILLRSKTAAAWGQALLSKQLQFCY